MTLDGFEITCESTAGDALEVVVGGSSRFFEGHFPDHPILPAIAQLALVEALLRRSCGDGARIASIERLRLLSVVHPGDRLRVRLGPGPAGPASARFEITRGASQVTEGTLRWSSVEA